MMSSRLSNGLLFALVLLAGCILYLSWKPEPDMKSLPLLPKEFLHWADKEVNGNIRTAVPLFVLGTLLGTWLALQKAARRQWWMFSGAVLALLLLAECIQLFLPHRHPDVGDVGWGMAGYALGLIPVAGLQYLARRKSVTKM